MCGIFCSLWHKCENPDEAIADYTSCKGIIKQRGPDSFAERTEELGCDWRARFAASILWMRGARLVEQPSIDSDGNILLWNGDIFSGSLLTDEDVSDTQTLLDALQASENVPETLKNIRGPFSVVYYQANRKLLYFARDRIGRHSLLLKVNPKCKALTLSSSASRQLAGAIELPAIGIFAVDLATSGFKLHPWRKPDTRSENLLQDLKTRLGIEIAVYDALIPEVRSSSPVEPEVPSFANFDDVPTSGITNINLDSSCAVKNFDVTTTETAENVMKSLSAKPEVRERVRRVMLLLKRSIQLRVNKKPEYCKNCVELVLDGKKIVCEHAKLGILFSGGLDSTILAALADEFVPRNESIDLINVAFEKPKKNKCQNLRKNSQNKINETVTYFDVPDRKTGRLALAELREIRPWRTWNFIECNVTQEELQKYRSTTIRDLVYPSLTILDDSLGCALWFASRGSGFLSTTEKLYDSPCRVLLLGMGADELFGGYTRHRTTLRRGGWAGLSEELDAELARIAERNLGRDDRVVSDHGRQSRLPYLDEDFVDYVTSLEPWERCWPTETMPAGLGDKLLLRLVAYDIGLCKTANFPKRAFQFGSRIANSKDNAKDLSMWL